MLQDKEAFGIAPMPLGWRKGVRAAPRLLLENAGGSTPAELAQRGSNVNAGQDRKTCLPVAAFFRHFRD